MIDLRFEKLHKFAVAAKFVPSSRLDRPVAPSTLYRWHKRGVLVGQTRVFLEAVRLPSGAATSVEAINRFLAELSGAIELPRGQDAPPRVIGNAVDALDADLF